MSFHDAKRRFDENLELMGGPDQDPLTWNLNTGLSELAESIQRSLEQLHSRLDRLERALEKK